MESAVLADNQQQYYSRHPFSAVVEDATASISQNSRKRRRRTAGGGAHDDCFSCRKRAVPCDRKRPYCTQCLDIGKECSGYKTKLTWGVGIASRGKLRGLSCPVANKLVGEADNDTRSVSSRPRTAVTKDKTTTASSSTKSDVTSEQLPLQAVPPAPLPIATGSFSPTSCAAAQGLDVWPTSDASIAGTRYSPPKGVALQRLQTSLLQHDDLYALSNSASSSATFAEAELQTPLDYPPAPPFYLNPHRPQYHYDSGYAYVDQPTSAPPINALPLEATPILGDHSWSLGEQLNSYPRKHLDCLTFQQPSHANKLSNDFDVSTFGHQVADIIEEESFAEPNGDLFPIWDSRFDNPLFHLPPRIQSLIGYYNSNVCPFLVAFDGPQNPYRMHIIHLASQNEGLQNAIAALATNNMRMRRKDLQQHGFMQDINHTSGHARIHDTDQPSAEESCYKQVSIDQLNMQLTNPHAAHDDSVLATLLILCLFHVCDSGFSRFKTQLAGVQKLLSLRRPHTQSAFTQWVEMFFIWFDVMTSTVNDRETQIKGESLDMLDLSVDLGALEQFSGCEGRLFKCISRLGRLSLLAQGRPVRPTKDSVSCTANTQKLPTSAMSIISAQPYTSKYEPNVAPNLPNAAERGVFRINNCDSPDLLFEKGAAGREMDSDQPVIDERQQFWAEWSDIRHRLETWDSDRLTLSGIPSTTQDKAMSSESLAPEQQDLIHIHESFRHSALLYLERLAYPLLPSSDARFQRHVARALFHMTALPVTSCVNKFLLWPLFITGTECVDPHHRAIIRTRCIEVQRESGFYNNLSGLEVLERVWRDANMDNGDQAEIHSRRRDSAVHHGSNCRQAFRWRRAMDRIDGEYLII